ncbi:MAG: hypothetical protein WCG45_03890 [bacterium]
MSKRKSQNSDSFRDFERMNKMADRAFLSFLGFVLLLAVVLVYFFAY